MKGEEKFALGNEDLRVTIALRGAELCSLFDKKRQEEVIWQGDSSIWGWQAPLLFPLVGKLRDDSYRYCGRQYRMTRHGFAREEKFELVEACKTLLRFRLTDNTDTRAIYPFQFQLDVIYRLEERKLSVQLEVENTGEKKLCFSIGAHPGFALPSSGEERREGYRLRIEGPGADDLHYYLVNPSSGEVDLKHSYRLHQEEQGIKLTSELFARDALIFDRGQISSVSILRPNGETYIHLNSKDFPDFGIWSVPGDRQPFICLEPWFGRSDAEGFSGELDQRYGKLILEPEEQFAASYSITVPPFSPEQVL